MNERMVCNVGLENNVIDLLEKKGFDVRSGSNFPSSIDLIATKNDRVILVEVKERSKIDSTDIVRLQSYSSRLLHNLGKVGNVTVFLSWVWNYHKKC